MIERVSFHAIVRWLERVEHLDLSTFRRDRQRHPDDASLARAAAAALGTSVEALAERICPPSLLPALDLGVRKILRLDHSLICAGGVVITVIDGRYGHRFGHGTCIRQREGVTRRGARRVRSDRRALLDGWEERA